MWSLSEAHINAYHSKNVIIFYTQFIDLLKNCDDPNPIVDKDIGTPLSTFIVRDKTYHNILDTDEYIMFTRSLLQDMAKYGANFYIKDVHGYTTIDYIMSDAPYLLSSIIS